MMHGSFLFVTWPGGGNVHPLVALGRRLLERGHDVRALGSADLAARFEAEGIGFRAHGSGAACAARDVVDEAHREATDVVVVDFMLPYATCGAEHTRLPSVAFVHTLCTSFAIADPSPMSLFSDVARINTTRGELGLSRVDRVPELLDNTTRVLVGTVHEFDGPDGTLPANVAFVGPIFEDPGPDAGWTPPWPDADAPLVVVSLGSTPMDETPVIRHVLGALADADARVLVTLGDHLDPGTFSAPGNAIVSGYVRHAAVLPHADLLVTHAGLSSIGIALAFGVPMVCVPLGRDQPGNAERVATVRAGRTVAPDAAGDALRAAVVDVLGDEAYRAAAQRMSSVILPYGNGSRATGELEQLLVRP